MAFLVFSRFIEGYLDIAENIRLIIISCHRIPNFSSFPVNGPLFKFIILLPISLAYVYLTLCGKDSTIFLNVLFKSSISSSPMSSETSIADSAKPCA